MTEKNNLQGIAMMAFGLFCVTFSLAIARDALTRLDVGSTLFVQASVGCLTLIFMAKIPFGGATVSLRPRMLKPLFFRSALVGLSGYLLLAGLQYLTVVEAAAILSLEPVFMFIVSIIFFGEHFKMDRVPRLALCTIGALLIVVPPIYMAPETSDGSLGAAGVVFGILFLLGRNTCSAFQKSTSRHLSKQNHAITIVLWGFVMNVIVSLPLIAGADLAPLADPRVFTPAALSGVFSVVGMVYMNKALKVAEVVVLSPVMNTRLVFGGLLGFAFFRDVPHAMAYLGFGAILAVMALQIFRIRERQRQGHGQMASPAADAVTFARSQGLSPAARQDYAPA